VLANKVLANKAPKTRPLMVTAVHPKIQLMQMLLARVPL
jgi:hypothetical protein